MPSPPEPEIIFFDEPTTGLDPIMAGVINDLIREIVTEMGATAVTITHDMSSVRAIADPGCDAARRGDQMGRAGRRFWTIRATHMSNNSSQAALKGQLRPCAEKKLYISTSATTR